MLSEYITYEPFTGKVFDIEPNDVTSIHIRVTRAPFEYRIEGKDNIALWVEKINSFRWHFWFPNIGPYRQEYSRQNIAVYTKDSSPLPAVTFWERPGIYYTDSVRYFCAKDFFDEIETLCMNDGR